MKIAILGATGSIGTQALEVVEDLRGIKEIEITGLSGNKNLKLLAEQIRKRRRWWQTPIVKSFPVRRDSAF